MQPFSQKITEARKSHGMTQEQVAQALNVSRQTISHWENGRLQPDEENKRRLCALLDIPVCEHTHEAAKRRSSGSFAVGFLCGALSMLLITCLILNPFKSEKVPAESEFYSPPQTQASIHDYEWYLQPNEREEGKAHLAFSLVTSPIQVVEQDTDPYVGWNVDYRFEEVNGVSFTITGFSEVYYTEEQDITYSSIFTGDEIAYIVGSVNMPPRGRIRYSVFKPVDATVLYGVCIEGIDGNGNECLFRYAIPLSQEIAP